MESQPENPEFRNKPESFHPCVNQAKDLEVILLKQVFPTFFSHGLYV